MLISIDEEERRIGRDGKFLFEFETHFFFHIDLHADEIGIEKGAYIAIRKDIVLQVLAGPAPGGIGIQENGFVATFSFGQDFFPGF